MKEDAKRFYNNLKRQAQENPLLALAVATALLTATAKVLDANTQRKNSKAWNKEVDRRVANTRSR
jgi:hypothetical protein